MAATLTKGKGVASIPSREDPRDYQAHRDGWLVSPIERAAATGNIDTIRKRA